MLVRQALGKNKGLANEETFIAEHNRAVNGMDDRCGYALN